MKKLLALVIAGGFLTALTGCPPATSPPAPPPPVKTTPADTKAADTKPMATKPADTKPAGGDKPTVTPPAVTKPVPPVTKPAGDKAVELKTHKGTFVKSEDGKLFMKDADDKPHDHIIGKETKIVDADGKTIELKDLKEGAKIEVTTDDKGVTKVEVMKK